MPINVNQIKVGGYYLAGKDCDQLRKIVEIRKDLEGRNRIVYAAKSAKIANRQFSPIATLANPALEQTFADACCKELTATDIAVLRKQNILLAGE